MIVTSCSGITTRAAIQSKGAIAFRRLEENSAGPFGNCKDPPHNPRITPTRQAYNLKVTASNPVPRKSRQDSIEAQRWRRAQYSGRTAVLTLIGDTGRAPQASGQVNPQAWRFNMRF